MTSFLEACGMNGPLVLLLEAAAGEEPQRRQLSQPFALVGRDLDSDVILKNPDVSRRHAYLQAVDGGIFCIDLGSRTGTHWPDGPGPAGWLPPGQSLRIGAHRLRLPGDSTGEQPERASPMTAGSIENPWFSVEFVNGRATQGRWTMNRKLALIGSAPLCKLRLHRPEVAPIHGCLVCTPSGVWVVDLLAPGGIALNGKRIRAVRVEDGDFLSIAGFTMRMRGRALAAPVAPAGPAPQPIAVAEPQAAAPPLPGTEISQLVPAATAFPLAATQARQPLLESILVPLIQQFGALQNQMFDQFHQAIGSMFQMFGALQKEQMAFIRQEWKQLQEVNQEIQALQAELHKQPPAALPATAEAESPVESAEPSPEPAAGPSKLPSNGVTAGPEIHTWLCQRMAELQEDSRTRLQKIVGFLSRK